MKKMGIKQKSEKASFSMKIGTRYIEVTAGGCNCSKGKVTVESGGNGAAECLLAAVIIKKRGGEKITRQIYKELGYDDYVGYGIAKHQTIDQVACVIGYLGMKAIQDKDEEPPF